MSKLATYKSRSLAAIKESRGAVRGVVNSVETVGGAALAGYVDATYPDGIAGVPGSAAAGLVLIGVGFGMRQSDLKSVGLGMLAGYAYAQGAAMARPATDA